MALGTVQYLNALSGMALGTVQYLNALSGMALGTVQYLNAALKRGARLTAKIKTK